MTTEANTNGTETTGTGWEPVAVLAPLLLYPVQPAAKVALVREELRARSVTLPDSTLSALELIESLEVHELEEVYTQTFDLNPVCTLEIGWHLYGEQYERGRFLVRARSLLDQAGVDEGGELPDFLPSLLTALPRSNAAEALDVGSYLVPALRAICKALEEKGQARSAEIYLPILQAVRTALEGLVPEERVEEAESRFRPQLEGMGSRGQEPGPNGDFPVVGQPGPGLVKLGVNAPSGPGRGAVHGIPLSEMTDEMKTEMKSEMKGGDHD